MFSKLSLIALVAPLVSGLVLDVPQNPTSGGSVTISWTNQQGDPSTWSFELVNTAFHNAFAIANNVDPSLNSITITLPVVPIGDGYTLEAVDIGNITNVFASTGDFSIANGTSTSTSSATSSTTATTSKVSTSTTSTKATGSVTSTTTSAPFTSVIVSSTAPASSSTATTTAATSGTSSTVTPTSAALSSRMSLGGSIGGFAAVILSAVAGVAMIAL